MTPQKFASIITGQECPFELSEKELSESSGLVVLWVENFGFLKADGLVKDERKTEYHPRFWLGRLDFCEQDHELTIEQCKKIVAEYDSSIQITVEHRPSLKVAKPVFLSSETKSRCTKV